MKKVIVEKAFCEKDGYYDDAHCIMTRMLYILYTDYTWESVELRYKSMGYGDTLSAKSDRFRTRNLVQRHMTKEEVHKYIQEFEESEGL